MTPNFDLLDNQDGTFTLSLYTISLDGSTATTYASMTAPAHDMVYDLLYNVVGFPPSDQPTSNLTLDFSNPDDAAALQLEYP